MTLEEIFVASVMHKPKGARRMNRSIVGRLVAKDLYLYRWLIAGALLAGRRVAASCSRFAAGDTCTPGSTSASCCS